MADAPEITITNISEQKRELWVEYELVNGTGQPLFLINQLSDKHKLSRKKIREKVSPFIAQTGLADPDTVHFLHGIAPMPAEPGVAYYGPIRPLALPVADGARLRITFRSPLPILEWSTYRAPVREGEQLVTERVTRARLSVDFLLDEHKFFADEHDEVPGAFVVNGNPIQRLRVEAALPRPCELLHTPGFPQFDEESGEGVGQGGPLFSP